MALLFRAANLRKIEAFVAEEEAEASGSTRRLPCGRISKSIEEFLPKPSPKEIASSEGSLPGPDLPLIA